LFATCKLARGIDGRAPDALPRRGAEPAIAWLEAGASSRWRHLDPRKMISEIINSKPAGIMSTRSFAKRFPASWRLAMPAEPPRRTPPVQHGALRIDFSPMLPQIPDLGLLTLAKGLLFGSQGWVFSSDRYFLRDCSWFGETADSFLLPSHLKNPQKLHGVCLSLASDYAKDNYAHFVLDSMSRLEIFKRAGGSLDEVDHIYLPRPPSTTAGQVMAALGIPPKKCIWAEDNRLIKANVLIATSFPGLKRNYPRWLPDSLRGHFPAPSASTSGRRIYVPRVGVRKVTNEAALIEIAREFGFETYDYSTTPNEPEFFASLSAVVGPHGAGLANIAFCSPGTKVLELVPSDHVYPYYYSLADAAGLEYHSLVGQSLEMRPLDSFGPSPVDFTVDAAEFRAALAAMG
jgi:hypothetical protein